MKFSAACSMIFLAALLAGANDAKLSVTPYGMAQYRLRVEGFASIPESGEWQRSYAYANRLAYKIGARIVPDSSVKLQFEIGNDWYATEDVHALYGNIAGRRNAMTPWFSQANAQWDPGYLRLAAGILPIDGSCAMDLIGTSLYWGMSYAAAAHLPWGIVANYSLPGLRAGAPFIKDEVSLDLDLFATVLDQRTALPAIPSLYKQLWSAVMVIADAPVRWRTLAVSPELAVIFNRIYRNDAYIAQAGDHEVFGGINASYDANAKASLRGGVGLARIANANTWSERDSVAGRGGIKVQAPQWSRLGAEGTAGVTIVFKHARLDCDATLSYDNLSTDPNAPQWYEFLDVRYKRPLTPHFTIMPCVRIFGITQPMLGTNSVRAWPELTFMGSF